MRTPELFAIHSLVIHARFFANTGEPGVAAVILDDLEYMLLVLMDNPEPQNEFKMGLESIALQCPRMQGVAERYEQGDTK